MEKFGLIFQKQKCKNFILFLLSPSGEVLPQIKTLIVVNTHTHTHTYHHFFVIHQIGINICIIWMCDLMQHVYRDVFKLSGELFSFQ